MEIPTVKWWKKCVNTRAVSKITSCELQAKRTTKKKFVLFRNTYKCEGCFESNLIWAANKTSNEKNLFCTEILINARAVSKVASWAANKTSNEKFILYNDPYILVLELHLNIVAAGTETLVVSGISFYMPVQNSLMPVSSATCWYLPWTSLYGWRAVIPTTSSCRYE
jgi:hypothetical protein